MRGVPGEGESFRKEAADLRKVGRQPRTTGGTLHLLLELRDKKGVISVEVERDNGVDSLKHLSQHPVLVGQWQNFAERLSKAVKSLKGRHFPWACPRLLLWRGGHCSLPGSAWWSIQLQKNRGGSCWARGWPCCHLDWAS